MLGLVLLLLGSALAGDPEVFADYFDDEIRFVDIPQDVVLNACLENGHSTVQKVMTAYDTCFGEDYSFDDLAETDGPDSDGDDLPDEFEGNEACFYEKMEWVSENLKELNPAKIKADMEGLPNAEQFNADVDSCAAWSGSFGADRRSKREVKEEVPSLMEAGSRALGWVKALVRKTRSAEPDKKGNVKKEAKCVTKGDCKDNTLRKKCDKGTGKCVKKGNGRKKNNNGKGKGEEKGKNSNVKKGAKCVTDGDCKGNTLHKECKKRTGKCVKKANGRKNNDNGKKAGKNSKPGKGQGNGNNRNSGEKKIKEETYNQLWCFDLALEQALEKCVEDKIKN